LSLIGLTLLLILTNEHNGILAVKIVTVNTELLINLIQLVPDNDGFGLR